MITKLLSIYFKYTIKKGDCQYANNVELFY